MNRLQTTRDRRKNRGEPAWVFLILLSGSAATALAATPAQQCASSKLAVAGEKAASKLTCHSQALRRDAAPAADCLLGAESHFDADFQRLDARGGCALSGDAANIEALIDELVTQVSSALNPSLTAAAEQKCAAKKLKTAALAARRQLKCHSKADRDGSSVDATCLDHTGRSFTAMFLRAEAAGTCGTRDDSASIGTMIDAFVNSVVAAIPTAPLTPTPSPTETATSTQSLPPAPTFTSPPPPTFTPTSCRGDLPAVSPLTSPTNLTTQAIHVCGRNGGSSTITVYGSAGAATLREPSGGGCVGPCPNPGNAACYTFDLPLLENTINSVTVCQNNYSCPVGGCAGADVYGGPLQIQQVP